MNTPTGPTHTAVSLPTGQVVAVPTVMATDGGVRFTVTVTEDPVHGGAVGPEPGTAWHVAMCFRSDERTVLNVRVYRGRVLRPEASARRGYAAGMTSMALTEAAYGLLASVAAWIDTQPAGNVADG